MTRTFQDLPYLSVLLAFPAPACEKRQLFAMETNSSCDGDGKGTQPVRSRQAKSDLIPLKNPAFLSIIDVRQPCTWPFSPP
jgi:hypothetical protein